MIYTIGKRKLDVFETGDSRKVRTPRQVVPWRDVAETCRTIDALLPTIDQKKINRPKRIIDGVARSGFWGAVFLNRWPDCSLIMNEPDLSCIDILNKNFPDCDIQTNDIYSWTPPESDILLFDFDDFTLRKSAKHKEILNRVSNTTDWLMVADNTCFGFKFGNLRHYGVATEEEYYELLDSEMRPFISGKKMVAVSSFMNAAMILYGDREEGEPIKYIDPSELFLSRGEKIYKMKDQTCPLFD